MVKGAAVSNAHATSPCSVLLSTCISMGNPMLELLQEPEAPLLITNDPTTRLLNGSHACKSLFLLFQKSCPSCHSFKFLSASTPQPDGVLVRNRGKNPYSPFIIHNSMAASMFFSIPSFPTRIQQACVCQEARLEAPNHPESAPLHRRSSGPHGDPRERRTADAKASKWAV